MSDGPVFVEKVDVEAMASYMAARWISEGDEEIWHNDLSEDDRNAWRRVAGEALDAALVGKRAAKVEEQNDCLRCGEPEKHDPEWRMERRFVTDWEESSDDR